MQWKSISMLVVAVVAASCAPDREWPTGLGEVSAYVSTLDNLTVGNSIHYQLEGGACATTTTALGYVIPDPYGSCWTVADEWGLGRIATASTTDDFDERVVDDGTGNQVWRFSNAVTGAFSDQPNSPSSPAVAGETTAFLWNDRGLNHTTPVISTRAPATTRYFHGGFRFKSATGATQTNLTLNVSPTARQSDRRNSFIGLVDAGTGLNVTFFDTGIGGTFLSSTIATGLSYTDWHKIDIYVEFVDGLNGDGSGNDIVTVLVNDVVAHVGTTWETFYQVATPTRPVGAVDALMFRASGTAAPATLGNGFYFDDVVVDNAALPPPTCVAGSYLYLGTCVAAPAGFFVATAGATEATACPEGTFQNQEGQTSCIPAPAGKFVAVTGAITANNCAAGTYQPDSGQSSCIKAPIGYYVDIVGSHEKFKCAPGTTTTVTGSVACVAVSGEFCAAAGPIGGIDIGSISEYLFVFSDGSRDANWQSSSRGYVGNVAINGLGARERSSGSFAYAGKIFTSASQLKGWQRILNNNTDQAEVVGDETGRLDHLGAELKARIVEISNLTATPDFESRSVASLSNLDVTGLGSLVVINVTSGFGGISQKINITGTSDQVIVMRWDSDGNPADLRYEGQVKFQSGGAIVPQGGLTPSNFIHVAGDLNASGGGSNPAPLYPQGPRYDDGQGSLINRGSDFSGGGFFTGYWLTTGRPQMQDPATGIWYGETASFSNAVFVGGWYSMTTKFSMTSGTSGVHVCPNGATIRP